MPVTGGTTYVASYYAPAGRYAASQGFFDSDWDAPPLSAPGASSGVANGVYADSQPVPLPVLRRHELLGRRRLHPRRHHARRRSQ